MQHLKQKDTILKKFAISLATLAAISTTALSSERNYDLRDSDTYFGKYSTQLKDNATAVNALPVVDDDQALTNLERLQKISEENDQGRH
jgi:hypothetical protein